MKDFSTSFLKPAIPFFLLLILIWLIHFFNIGYDLELHTFGIYPRKITGLIGILLSPLIHSSSDIKHIINNSPPLIILGWALLYFYKEIAFKIFCYSWFLVGFFGDSFHFLSLIGCYDRGAQYPNRKVHAPQQWKKLFP